MSLAHVRERRGHATPLCLLLLVLLCVWGEGKASKGKGKAKTKVAPTSPSAVGSCPGLTGSDLSNFDKLLQRSAELSQSRALD
jgi:hypothetical protein